MEPFLDRLSQLPLFSEFTRDELVVLSRLLSLSTVTLHAEEYILHAEETKTRLGCLLTGSAQVFLTDYWGRRSILNNLKAGDLLGGAAAFLPVSGLPINIVALTNCTVLLMDAEALRTGGSRVPLLSRLQGRIGTEIAQTNLALIQKLSILSRRSTREKAMAYFSGEALRKGSPDFQIPFTRDELADYLCVNCSALSTELSKLQRDGVIRFKRNRFHLLDTSFQ